MTNIGKINSFDDIRNMLADVAVRVLNGELPPAQANAGTNALGKVITSIKVEGDIRRIVGNIKGPLPLQLKDIELKQKKKEEKETKE